MKKILKIIFCMMLCFLPAFAINALGETPEKSSSKKTTIEAGPLFGYLNGDSTYHISSYDMTGSGIESELAFPLKTYMAGIHGKVALRDAANRDRYTVNFRLLRNIDSRSGKMQDSDWLTDDIDISLVGAPHSGKDIYSESDILLTAYIFDVHAVYSYWPRSNISIGPLFGFTYEYFHFDVSNTNQVGYGPYAATYTGSISGKTLEYEVNYYIPYVGVNSELVVSNQFQIGIELGYSPSAQVQDRDDHLARSKLSKGSTSGYAYFSRLNLKWNITQSEFFQTTANYLKIETTGMQNQYFYGGPYAGQGATVDDKITSTQVSMFLMLGHRF
jgi:outer membrane protease